MRRSFQYKAQLSPLVAQKARNQLDLCRELYNGALQERRDAWRMAGKSVSAFDQKNQLPAIKEIRPEFREIGSQALQDVIERAGRAFDAFFRRVKNGEKAGYPRFKAQRQYDSITFKQTAGWKLGEVSSPDKTRGVRKRSLTLQGIGSLKLFWSRELEGTVKTVTLKKDRCGDWWVTFSCDDVPVRPLPETGRSIGIDLGLGSLVATSDGQFIENPRHLRKAEVFLKRSQRRVSKRLRGGSNRRKMAMALARRHRKVQRTRRDFHFKLAFWLVNNYDLIAAEQLNVLGLSRGLLAKGINDAALGQFISILISKAESAGKRVVPVNPRNTSQMCSGCGHLPDVRKTLNDRVHHCDQCGLVMDRDTNAAINILKLAVEEIEREQGAGQVLRITAEVVNSLPGPENPPDSSVGSVQTPGLYSLDMRLRDVREG